MAEIGALVANLELETAAFRKDLDKAVTALNANAAKMNQAFAGIEKRARQMNVVVGGFITGWVGGKAVAAINNALALADNIGKQAQNVGLSARSYQELLFAQEQLGGSTEGINKAMLQFNRIIGEAANGNRKAAESLRLVGIAQQDLKSQSIEQLYVRATTTIGSYADSARRATAIQKLFGEEALKTATAFAVNAQELNALRSAAHSAGVVLDESTIQNAEKTKDEMEKLSKVISIQLTQAFLQWAPLLVKATGFLADLGEMASWAARKIGLLSNVTLEQQYQALLEKRLDISERLFQMERGGTDLFGGSFSPESLAKVREELAGIDAQLASLRTKMAANAEAGGAVGKPGASPAVTGTITPITGDASGAGEIFGPDREKEASRYFEFLAEKQTKEAEAAATRRQQIYDDFEAMRLSFDAEYAATQERNTRMLELNAYYREFGLEQDATYNEIERQIMLEHQAALGDSMAKAKLEGLKFEKMALAQKLSTVIGFGESELAAVANTNKTLFKIHKAFALAQLAVAMPAAIGEAVEKGGGLPWGAVFGALTAAKYVALIAQAKSANFGTSTSPANVGGGGATPVFPAPGAGVGAAPPNITENNRRLVTINVDIIGRGSRIFTDEEVREVLAQVQEQINDGGGPSPSLA